MSLRYRWSLFPSYQSYLNIWFYFDVHHFSKGKKIQMYVKCWLAWYQSELHVVPLYTSSGLVHKQYTFPADSLINCFAESFHIAGTDITHNMSSSNVPSFLQCICWMKWSFKKPIAAEKTAFADILFLPTSSNSKSSLISYQWVSNIKRYCFRSIAGFWPLKLVL